MLDCCSDNDRRADSLIITPSVLLKYIIIPLFTIKVASRGCKGRRLKLVGMFQMDGDVAAVLHMSGRSTQVLTCLHPLRYPGG